MKTILPIAIIALLSGCSTHKAYNRGWFHGFEFASDAYEAAYPERMKE